MTSDELKRLRELMDKPCDGAELIEFSEFLRKLPWLLDQVERLHGIERLVGELRTAEQQRLRESGDTTGDSPTLAGLNKILAVN